MVIGCSQTLITKTNDSQVDTAVFVSPLSNLVLICVLSAEHGAAVDGCWVGAHTKKNWGIRWFMGVPVRLLVRFYLCFVPAATRVSIRVRAGGSVNST